MKVRKLRSTHLGTELLTKIPHSEKIQKISAHAQHWLCNNGFELSI